MLHSNGVSSMDGWIGIMRGKGFKIDFISIGTKVLCSANGIEGMRVNFVECHVAHGLSDLRQESMIEVGQVEIARYPVFHPWICKEHIGKAEHELKQVLSVDRAHDSQNNVWKVE